MKLRNLISGIVVGAVLISGTTAAQAEQKNSDTATKQTQIQLIRNATLKITYADTTFLIDPMLAEKGAYPGFEGTYRSHIRNPMIDLPMTVADVIAGVDAIIVTHTHLDHWDDAAQQLLPKELPIFTQNAADAELIRSQGFKQVSVLAQSADFAGITLTKTGGQHGTNEMYTIAPLAEALGDAMGVMLQAPGYKTTYVVGDTVWHADVEQALDNYQPEIVILNTGYAQLEGFERSIIMGKDDVIRVNALVPKAAIIGVHMDAVNHAALSREELRVFVNEKGIADSVKVPADGEILKF